MMIMMKRVHITAVISDILKSVEGKSEASYVCVMEVAKLFVHSGGFINSIVELIIKEIEIWMKISYEKIRMEESK